MAIRIAGDGRQVELLVRDATGRCVIVTRTIGASK